MLRPQRRPSVLRELLDSEAAGGLCLMSAAAIALFVANSPLAGSYVQLVHAPLGPLHVLHWINDGLMALFFLFVGLEIKREVLDGQPQAFHRVTCRRGRSGGLGG